MRVFRVYRHQTHGYEAIKRGFSWPGFFFWIVWALTKRLWAMSLLLFLIFSVSLIVDLIEKESHSAILAFVYWVLYLSLWLLPGYKGNQWRENRVVKKGYTLVDTITSNSPEEAIIASTTKAQNSEQAEQSG